MKLYGDFTNEDWLQSLDINKEDIPLSFVIHGEWEHKENLNLWRAILNNDYIIPKWNTLIGSYQGQKIGFSNTYGSSIAINITHPFASVGTSLFIQTGYFGGLSNKVQYGDILIVTEAEIHDGISNWYFPNQKIVKSDEMLVSEAVKFCERNNYNYVTGSVISTNSLLHETKEMIESCISKGHLAIDMETASTLTVAKYFNKKAISILNLSDHLIKGDTLYNYTDEREELEEKTDEKIREIALHLASMASQFDD